MPRVVIIGSGFGGLAMAIELKRHGHNNFLVLEEAEDIGGVWRDNTYPGAACDIPSRLYSYSYEQKFPWSSRFARQAEIQEYLKTCARKYGIDQHLRLRTRVVAATFQDRKWQLTTSAGETIEADVLVPACGQLSRPAMPDLPGLGDFTGAVVHSARWPAGLDLAGRRVAVVGTGSSALQIVPAIAGVTRHLTVFQRTAPHILPRWDRVYPTGTKRRPMSRLGWWLFYESMVLGITRWRPATAGNRLGNRAQLAKLDDAELRDKLTPQTEIGCKRIGVSSDYYATLAQKNVTLVTEPIRDVIESGIRTEDGNVHEADVIVMATGFATGDFLAPIRIRGRDGRALDELWATGAHAYLGMAVPGFPNMFLMYGPNTNPGVGSVIYMLESQARYIRRAVSAITGGRTLEVREDREDRFDRKIQRRMAKTSWSTCRSWYRHPSGRVTHNWPGQTFEYRWLTRKPNLADYVVTIPDPYGPPHPGSRHGPTPRGS